MEQPDEHISTLIENYLLDRMAGEERAAFERRMEAEPALRQEVAFQRLVTGAVQSARRQELKDYIRQNTQERRRGGFIYWYSAAAVILLTIISVLYLRQQTRRPDAATGHVIEQQQKLNAPPAIDTLRNNDTPAANKSKSSALAEQREQPVTHTAPIAEGYATDEAAPPTAEPNPAPSVRLAPQEIQRMPGMNKEAYSVDRYSADSKSYFKKEQSAPSRKLKGEKKFQPDSVHILQRNADEVRMESNYSVGAQSATSVEINAARGNVSVVHIDMLKDTVIAPVLVMNNSRNSKNKASKRSNNGAAPASQSAPPARAKDQEEDKLSEVQTKKSSGKAYNTPITVDFLSNGKEKQGYTFDGQTLQLYNASTSAHAALLVLDDELYLRMDNTLYKIRESRKIHKLKAVTDKKILSNFGL